MTDIVLPDLITTVEELIREVPVSEPGKKILISFIIDYTPDSTEYAAFIEAITGGEDFVYDMSLDPFYIYSTSYLEKKITEWFDKMEEFTDGNPDVDDLHVSDGQVLQGIVDGFGTNQEKITQFLQSIFTTISSCKLGGGTDIWLSFCGQYIQGNSDDVVAYSPTDIWINHIDAIEPDYAIIINRDIKYFMGQANDGTARTNTYWYLGDTEYVNTYTRSEAETNAIGLTTSAQGSKNFVDDISTVLDRVACLGIIPVILHTNMQVRSQFDPIPFDFNSDGIIDGEDLNMQGKVGIDNLVGDNRLLISLPNIYSKYMLLVFGDVRIRPTSESRDVDLTSPVLEHINCASAIGGFLSTLGSKYGFRPVINKTLQHIDIYKDIDGDQIDILNNSFITPLRRTIRNGNVTLGSNRVYYRVPSDYISGYDSNNDQSYDLGRTHCIVFCNYIRKELLQVFEPFIGGSKANVIAAASTIIANIMHNKPVVEYTYDIKHTDIDTIELIIIIRMLNGITDVSSSITVGNLS
jgi:hypothetical protein